jgi:hypothetical protein
MTKFNIEFQNCSLEINYVGTETEIAFQKAVDALDNISETLECLKRAVFKACDSLIEFFRPIFDELVKETDTYLSNRGVSNSYDPRKT